MLPTTMPSLHPTPFPTSKPTLAPTPQPTSMPTLPPTDYPSFEPSAKPTTEPTSSPTFMPSLDPTVVPTMSVSNQQLSQYGPFNEAKEAGKDEARMVVDGPVSRVIGPILLLIGLTALGALIRKVVQDSTGNTKKHKLEFTHQLSLLIVLQCIPFGLLMIFQGYVQQWFVVGTGQIESNLTAKTLFFLFLYVLPENVDLWTYSLMIFHWAGILFGGLRRRGGDDNRLKYSFYVMNSLLTLESVIAWSLIFKVQIDHVKPIAFFHQAVFATTSLALALLVLVCGAKLSSTIDASARRHGNAQTRHRNRAAARQTIAVSMVLASIWLVMTVIRGSIASALTSKGVAEFYYGHRTWVDGIYYSLRCFAITIVLFMYGPFRRASAFLSEAFENVFKKMFSSFRKRDGLLAQSSSLSSKSGCDWSVSSRSASQRSDISVDKSGTLRAQC